MKAARTGRIATVAAMLVVVVLILTGACDVSESSNKEPTPQGTVERGTVQRGRQINIDLTKRLTREELGFAKNENFRFYQRPSSGEMLQVSVATPRGTLSTPAFEVASSTDGAGGLHDKDFTHQPKALDVISRYRDAAEAFEHIERNADAMGLRAAEVTAARDEVGQGGQVSQSRVLHGFVQDWLSSQVTVRDSDEGQVVVLYQFEIDYFHNEAVDKVLTDGRFAVDLTTKPSRESLGFLPTYGTADLRAEWGRRLAVSMTTGRGTVQVADTSFNSSADPADGPPRFSYFTLSGTLDQVRPVLEQQTDALGIDRVAVDRILGGNVAVEETLQGVETEFATLAVKVSLHPDSDPKSSFNSADVVYQINWK